MTARRFPTVAVALERHHARMQHHHAAKRGPVPTHETWRAMSAEERFLFACMDSAQRAAMLAAIGVKS